MVFGRSGIFRPPLVYQNCAAIARGKMRENTYFFAFFTRVGGTKNQRNG
nr:MAG TPA: hypothetical protein [Caudoviricetes sp.]